MMHHVVTSLCLLMLSLLLLTAASPLDTEEYQMVLTEINVFIDHTNKVIFSLDKQL